MPWLNIGGSVMTADRGSVVEGLEPAKAVNKGWHMVPFCCAGFLFSTWDLDRVLRDAQKI